MESQTRFWMAFFTFLIPFSLFLKHFVRAILYAFSNYKMREVDKKKKWLGDIQKRVKI